MTKTIELTPHDIAAAGAIRALAAGQELPHAAADYGAWQEIIDALQAASETSVEQAKRTLAALCRADKELATLLAVAPVASGNGNGNGHHPGQELPHATAELDSDESGTWAAPLPLRSVAVEPFPIDALPDWLAGYVTGVASELEVDTGAPALFGLAVLSAIFQRRHHLVITTGVAPWTETLSLWGLFIAEPGERKSAAIKALTFPLLAYQRDYNARMQALHANEMEICDDELSPPAPPAPLALALTDATPEALVLTLAEQQERAAIFTAEGNALFSVHLGGKYTNGNADLSLFNAAWSGDAQDISRKRDRQRTTLYHPALAMGVSLQPGVLSAASESRVARASGFLSRWLYCCPDSQLGQRTHSPPHSSDAPRQAYEKRITAMLEEAFPAVYPPPAVAESRAVSLDGGAFQALRAYQRATEPRLASTHALVVYRDWYAKAPGQAARVAALLALADRRATIAANDIQRGIAVVEWSAAHMQRVYSISVGADIPLAQRAVAWLQRKGASFFTARALQRALTVSATVADECITTLIEYGYIREVDSKRRTAATYAVHSSLLCGHD